jgi:hypothetical protein
MYKGPNPNWYVHSLTFMTGVVVNMLELLKDVNIVELLKDVNIVFGF